MPFIIKTTFVFALRSSGWTESYFTSNPNDDLKAQFDTWSGIAAKRARLLGKEAAITAIRCSIELDEASQKVTQDSYLGYVRYPGPDEQTAEDPSTALQVIWRSQKSLRRKLLFMRGIWDSIVGNGGQFLPATGTWQTFFDDWKSSMQAQGAGWMKRVKAATANITDYTVDADSQVVEFELDEDIFGPGPYKPQVARIAGLNGRSILNGQQVINATSGTTPYIVKPIAAGPFVSAGRITIYNTLFELAANIDGQKIVTRKAGAPLLASRGRAAVRART